MLQMMMGARVYDTDKFKQAMDSRYYPLDAMKQSVAILKNADSIDIETMEFGQYQPILAPLEINPNGPKPWLKSVGFARLQLSAQPNTTPLSKDEPDVIPLTRCALLDACIRKCFNRAGVGVWNGKQRAHASEFDDGLSVRRSQILIYESLMSSGSWK
jgi:hypothetical protein